MYQELLKEWIKTIPSKENREYLKRSVELKVFAEWLDNRAAQQSVHPTPLTLFGMPVEIANWLKPGQWFIRPPWRG